MILLAIFTGAGLGALLRFLLGSALNSVFPTIPLGTLSANLIGGFLMGLFMAITKNHTYLPDILKIGIATGFLGGLTTFSTFSAETVSLIANEEYLWTTLMILAHVTGSICLTITGIYAVKFFTS
jgi:CrcB protein